MEHRKLLAILLSFIIGIGLVGCSKEPEDTTSYHTSVKLETEQKDKFEADTDVDSAKTDNTNINNDNNEVDLEVKLNTKVDIDTSNDKSTEEFNIAQSNDVLSSFYEQYGKDHVVNVSDTQYYVDNKIETLILDDIHTKQDLIDKVKDLGTITEDNEYYILNLNKPYSYEEISQLESELNKEDWILAMIINIIDNSDWYNSEIPIN